MIAAEAQSSSPPAPSSDDLIPGTELNPSDVLLGRGPGSVEYIGNQRFRRLVEPRQAEYTSARKHKAKQKVAREVFDHIRSLGGRFLKEVNDGSPVNNAEEGVWIEVDESVALEKCKQALRQQKRETESSGDRARVLPSSVVSLSPSSAARVSNSALGSPSGLSDDDAVARPFRGALDGETTSLPMCRPLPVLPSMLDRSMGFPFVVDAPLVTFHQQTTMPHPEAIADANPPTVPMPQVLLREDTSQSVNLNAAAVTYNDPYFLLGDSMIRQNVPNGPSYGIENRVVGIGQLLSGSVSMEGHSFHRAPNELSESLLAFMEESDRPRFTEEQEELEKALMTDEEKAAALSDLFGRFCSVEGHRKKKARRDLDHNSIDFLVNQMRLEIERIPLDRKWALVEAQGKCCAEEFTDARLERFLRCEGMNVKLGAQRFVNYWESRRELFGPEKFVLRMTLDEALRDDLVAIEACLCRLLPHLDTSGRQLLLWEPGRHTREGYTTDSMLRALWYVIEVTAQENNDVRSGVVMIVWAKESSIFDFDHRLNERMMYFEKACWPVKRIAVHSPICFCPWVMTKIIKPIIYAWIDKHTRSRHLFHTVPESQLLDVFSDYGILRNMLPTQMGGTVRLDQAEWIANRRAVELGEV